MFDVSSYLKLINKPFSVISERTRITNNKHPKITFKELEIFR
jgi:hypothetical protein